MVGPSAPPSDLQAQHRGDSGVNTKELWPLQAAAMQPQAVCGQPCRLVLMTPATPPFYCVLLRIMAQGPESRGTHSEPITTASEPEAKPGREE